MPSNAERLHEALIQKFGEENVRLVEHTSLGDVSAVNLRGVLGIHAHDEDAALMEDFSHYLLQTLGLSEPQITECEAIRLQEEAWRSHELPLRAPDGGTFLWLIGCSGVPTDGLIEKVNAMNIPHMYKLWYERVGRHEAGAEMEDITPAEPMHKHEALAFLYAVTGMHWETHMVPGSDGSQTTYYRTQEPVMRSQRACHFLLEELEVREDTSQLVAWHGKSDSGNRVYIPSDMLTRDMLSNEYTLHAYFKPLMPDAALSTREQTYSLPG